jgi:hypothetical protein
MGTIEEEMIGVFADWHNNDKTDLRLYLLGTNRNSKEKQNIEAGLK